MTDSIHLEPKAAADGQLLLLSDERLMEMIRSQRHNGLDQLHFRYASRLKGLIINILQNDADADDVLHDVFLDIWNRAANYNPLRGSPISWIATIARRRSIDRLRRNETYRRVQERFTEQRNNQTESWTHVREEVTQFEMHAHLQRAMAKLPVEQRKAIKLAYQQQMSQREIAAHTRTPLGTIKTRLELGLKKMAVSLHGMEELL